MRLKKQFAVSLGVVLVTAGICFGVSEWLGYKAVALVMLLSVSLIAISFDIWPVLLAATLSAFIWDFVFIPPRFTLHVNSAEDAILLSMYFIIALVNGVLTYKIRQMEKASRKKEEKSKTLELYDTLLNSLSHELRTPIATIIAATDNLQAGQVHLNEETRVELTGEIASAAFRLNEQVENLLNMSRLESGFIKPRIDWTDIHELIYETIKKIETNKVSQRITVNIHPDMPLLKTDKQMLGQVLYNLLNNATQYTPPQSVINVIAVVQADVFTLTVEDNGPGFPNEEIENVFDKFYRLKSSHTGGTGLGLSIVKGFVKALSGNIVLENVLGGGARFSIQLPARLSYLKSH